MALMVFASTGGVRVCVCVCVCLRVRVVCVRVCAVQGTSSVTYIVYCWLLCCCNHGSHGVCKYGWCACVCVCVCRYWWCVCVCVQCKAQVVSPTLFIAAFSAAAPHGSHGVCKYGWCVRVCVCACVCVCGYGWCVCVCVQCKAQVVSPTLFIAGFSAAAPHGSHGVCKYKWCACACVGVFASTGGVHVCVCVSLRVRVVCVCVCVQCSARHK